MLPDFRFIIGATLATSLLGMTALGLFAATRLAHHAKIGPLEASRSLAFADRSEQGRFYDAETARRLDGFVRSPDSSEVTGAVATAAPVDAPPASPTQRSDIAEPAAVARAMAVSEEHPASTERAQGNDRPRAVMAFPTAQRAAEPAAADAAEVVSATAPLGAQSPISTGAMPEERAVPEAPLPAQPVEVASPLAAAISDKADDTGAAAAPSAEREPADTASITPRSEPAPAAGVERVAAATASSEVGTAQPEQGPVRTPATVEVAALPKSAVTVRPVRHAAPPTSHAVALPAPERTAPRTRIRAQPQYQAPYAGPQLTGFEWAGIYAKPQAAESYQQQPYAAQQQQYVAQPFAQSTQQRRAQSYAAQSYARDPYVDNRWRPWSGFQSGQTNRW